MGKMDEWGESVVKLSSSKMPGFAKAILVRVSGHTHLRRIVTERLQMAATGLSVLLETRDASMPLEGYQIQRISIPWSKCKRRSCSRESSVSAR